MIEFLIAGIVGLLVGVVIGFLVANGKKQALVTQVEVLKAAKEALEDEWLEVADALGEL